MSTSVRVIDNHYTTIEGQVRTKCKNARVIDNHYTTIEGQVRSVQTSG